MAEQEKKKLPTYVIVLRVVLCIITVIMLYRVLELKDLSFFPLAIIMYIIYLFSLKY